MGSSLVVAGVFIPIIRRLSWGRFHHAFGAEADVERVMSGRRNTDDRGIKAQVETGSPQLQIVLNLAQSSSKKQEWAE